MSDDLDAIGQQLAESGLWIHPSMAGFLSPEQVAEAERLIADAPVPVHLVLRRLDPSDEWAGKAGDYLSRLHDHTGVPGVYLMVDDPEPPFQAVTARVWGHPEIDGWDVEETGGEGAPVDQVMATLGSLSTGTVREDAQVSREESYSSYEESRPDDGFPTGEVVLWGGSLIVLACLARWVVVPFLKRGKDDGYGLPASVLDRAREARDDDLWRTAQRELLALGEEIDSTDLAAERGGPALQTSLDHYEAASRLLGDRAQSEVSVPDVVGALVLTRSGRRALTAAVAGKPDAPTTPCFLHPLHNPADGKPVHLQQRRVPVPLCSACRADLKARRAPEIFDVTWRGRSQHYFETDAEPWASTGYGALDPDLLTRLRQRRA